jgi:HipA-like protein
MAAMNIDPKTLNALAVSLRGRHIGVINPISGDRYLFSFEQDYIEDANRPTLSLSFKKGKQEDWSSLHAP